MDARTVNFDSYNSKTNLGLFFRTLYIGAPEPQIAEIEIPFRNGTLDITDSFGDVRFNNREIDMEFSIPAGADTATLKHHMAIYTDVQQKLHGKKMKITFSADQSYYYFGRVVVGELSNDNGHWVFPITAICEPFKYKQQNTVKSGTATASGTAISCPNAYAPVCPKFTVSNNNTQIIFGSISKVVSAGEHKFGDIIFKGGANSVTVKGTGTVTITYLEGTL